MTKKLLSILLVLFVILGSFSLVSCGKKDDEETPKEHVCEHVCPTCGKCTDQSCTDPKCADKCLGHEEHTCGHVCPICGKCTDQSCTDPKCADKCPGHEEKDNITHKDPFVTSLPEGSVTRVYNADLDTMYEDYSAESHANVSSALRVLVDNKNGDFPGTSDAAIYKVASGTYDFDKYEGIGFRIRLVGEGTLSYDNLILALRGADAYKVYEISLADALDADGEALPTLTSEFQDVIISPNQTLEDDTVEYALAADGSSSGTKVLDEYLGFHLYATGICSQVIEISEVFLVNAGEKTVIDNFKRANVGEADDNCWWRGSTGFIVQQGLVFSKNIKATLHLDDNDKANVVFNVMGDASGISFKLENGETKTLADLKDPNGNAIPNAVNGAYFPVVINLENSGITGNSIVVTSTTELYVSQIFFSDLDEKEAATEYPTLDPESIVIFDSFTRTQTHLDDNYDDASTNEVVTGSGINYAISYNHSEKTSNDGNHLVIEGVEAPDYVQVAIGSVARKHEVYLVIVMKLLDGATLDDFRIQMGGAKTKYANEWLAAQGLPSVPADLENYEYQTEDGYVSYIIDLELTGFPMKDDLDFYYTGAGKVLIDEVYFASYVGFVPPIDPEEEEEEKVDATLLVNTTIDDLAGYAYVGGFTATGKAIKMVVTSNTIGQTLKSLRFQGESEKWFKDGAVFDVDGNAISGDTEIPAEGLTLYVDLEASGLNLYKINHLHSGGYDSSTGDITVQIFDYTVQTLVEKEVEDLTGYAYVGGFTATNKVIKMVVTSSTEGQNLMSLRFQGESEKWFKDGVVFDVDGNVITGDTVIPTEGLTLFIDLEASGLNVGKINHLHSGGFETSAGDIKVVIVGVPEEKEEEPTPIMEATTVEDLTGYAYVGAFKPNGAFVKMLITSNTEGQTIKSLRIEGFTTSWFKDGAIFDLDGNAISGDTVIPEDGLTLYIDLRASGLKVDDFNHIHSGGFETSSGDITITVYDYEVEALQKQSFEDISGYTYAQGFTSNTEIVKLVFTSNSEGQTLASVRIEGANGAKWFKDNQIFDPNGNAISGDTVIPANGLILYVDLRASGLNIGAWNHVHMGGEGATGDMSYEAYETGYAKIQSQSFDDISGYTYAQGFQANGRYVKLVFSSNTIGQTLASVRIEGANGAKWFKDNQIIGYDGQVISAETVVPQTGVAIIIDLKESGLNVDGWNHIHMGGYEDTTGDMSYEAYNYLPTKSLSAKFVDGENVTVVKFAPLGEINAPKLEKEGYYSYWENFEVGEEDITVNAIHEYIYTQVLVDFEDHPTNADVPVDDANWKAEKYDGGWVAYTGVMQRYRGIGDTRVINMAAGYNMTNRYTYTLNEAVLTNYVSVKLSNHFSGASEIGVKIIAVLENDVTVYLLGSADEFYQMPVTEGLIEFSAKLPQDITVKAIQFVNKSSLNSAYLYADDLFLGYAKEKLATPQIEATASGVTWEAIEGATDYDIYVNGTYYANVTECKFAPTGVPTGNYKIEVVAKKGFEYSEKSNEVNVTVYDLLVAVWGQNGSNTYATLEEVAGLKTFLEEKFAADGKTYSIGTYLVSGKTDAYVQNIPYNANIILSKNTSSQCGTVDPYKQVAVVNYTFTSARNAGLLPGNAENEIAIQAIKYMCDQKVMVTVNNGEAQAATLLGEKVSLAYTPEEGYKLDGWALTADGEIVIEKTKAEVSYNDVKDLATDGAISLFPIVSVQEGEHTCGHVCPVCGKCTDQACSDAVCAEKCLGCSLVVAYHAKGAKETTTYITDEIKATIESELNDKIAEEFGKLGLDSTKVTITWVQVTGVVDDADDAIQVADPDVVICHNQCFLESKCDKPVSAATNYKTTVSTDLYNGTNMSVAVVDGAEWNRIAIWLYDIVANYTKPVTE